jgi:SAM-dependent methyltransferase
MPMHPLAREFASVAEVYEHGRPDYPPPVAETLTAELGLTPGDPVLDLAAGTGKLTRALVAAGLDVSAVEPLAPLRAILTASVGAARVHDGLAEEIPFPDDAFAAITVADAFHWFEPRAALAEMGRVLRPGGGLALISTLPDWSSAPWGHELGTLLTETRTEHPYFDDAPWEQTLAAAEGWSAPRRVTVTTSQPATPERIVDYVRSMSWVAAAPERERARMIARVRDMVATGTPDTIAVHAVMWLSAHD